MLDVVAVRIERNSERVEVCCDWAGGMQTRHDLVRTVRRFEQLHEFDELLAHIRQLRAQGCPASVVAERLNAEGWRPPKRATFNEPMVQRMLFRYGLSAGRPIWATRVSRQSGAEWTLQEFAARLGIHRHTAYRWLRDGRLPARIASRGDQRIWIVQMTEAELESFTSGRTDPLPKPDPHSKPASRVIMEKRSRMCGSICEQTFSATAYGKAMTPSDACSTLGALMACRKIVSPHWALWGNRISVSAKVSWPCQGASQPSLDRHGDGCPGRGKRMRPALAWN